METPAVSATLHLQSRQKSAMNDSEVAKSAKQHVHPLEEEMRNVKENRTNVSATLFRKPEHVRSQTVFTFTLSSATHAA
jgi:hypothetical protein